jgi:hypothetical protein
MHISRFGGMQDRFELIISLGRIAYTYGGLIGLSLKLASLYRNY